MQGKGKGKVLKAGGDDPRDLALLLSASVWSMFDAADPAWPDHFQCLLALCPQDKFLRGDLGRYRFPNLAFSLAVSAKSEAFSDRRSAAQPLDVGSSTTQNDKTPLLPCASVSVYLSGVGGRSVRSGGSPDIVDVFERWSIRDSFCLSFLYDSQ